VRTTDASSPAVDAGPLDFTAPEVKQLWWFLDGAIMNVDTRHHLWRSWGLCSRHAWGYAIAEIEVRGGKPFSTAILYEDLALRASAAMGQRLRSRGHIRSQLETHESCFACEYVSSLPGGELEMERAQWEETAKRVNHRTRTLALVGELRGAWESRSCPACLGGDGLVCRPHLLLGVESDNRLAAELAALARRLRVLANSLTTRRTPAGPLDRASWIEALGWFGGWDYAVKLKAELGGEALSHSSAASAPKSDRP
jgi:hypothetical protein